MFSQSYYHPGVHPGEFGWFKTTATADSVRRPLDGFLSEDVIGVEIKAFSYGCFHAFDTAVRYEVSRDGFFVQINHALSGRTTPLILPKQFAYDSVLRVLRQVNDDPDAAFTLTDMHLTDEDISAAVKQLAADSLEGRSKRKQPDVENYFRAKIAKMEKADANEVIRILYSPFRIYSTESKGMEITFTNSNGAQLVFLHVTSS